MHSKKHLNFTGLRKLLSSSFNRIAEFRQEGKVNYSIHDALMSGFACMYFQDPSMAQFQARMQEEQNKNNLATLFGVQNIPKDNQMRNIIDKVGDDGFQYFFEEYVRLLQRGKQLQDYQILPGLYLAVMDASGFFSSETIHCPGCLTRNSHDDEGKETGKITYMHQALQMAIVHPDKREVLPLMPEEIKNTDGTSKQDCEVNAAKRLIKKLKAAHPRLGVILGGDDLYSRQPMIEEILSHNMHYLFVAKPSSHKYLQEWIDAYDNLSSHEHTNAKGEKYVIEWVNDVPLHGGKDAIKVNYMRCRVYKNGKQVYINSWVTDLELDIENVYKLARGGRCRWRIENECFNTLKNQGYNMERNYGHGEKNLCFNFYLLTLIAFTFHQIFELTDKLYQACRLKCRTKREMWSTLRAYVKAFVFDSWEFLLNFCIDPGAYLQIVRPPPCS